MKLKTEHFLTLFLILFAFTGRAQLPTNNLPPAAVSVHTDTNGVLLAPANFFATNSALINLSKAGGIVSPANGGLGFAMTNLIPAGANYDNGVANGYPVYTFSVMPNAEYFAWAPGTGAGNDQGVYDNLGGGNVYFNQAFSTTASSVQLFASSPSTPVLARLFLITNQIYAALNGTFSGTIAGTSFVPDSALSNDVVLANSSPTLNGLTASNLTITSNVYVVDSLSIGNHPSKTQDRNTTGAYPFIVSVNQNTYNQTNGYRPGVDVQADGQVINYNPFGGAGFSYAEVASNSSTHVIGVKDANAIFFGWINDNAPETLFGGHGAIIFDPGLDLIIGGPVAIAGDTGVPNHEQLGIDQVRKAVFFPVFKANASTHTNASAVYGLFDEGDTSARGGSFIAPSNFYSGNGRYFFGTNTTSLNISLNGVSIGLPAVIVTNTTALNGSNTLAGASLTANLSATTILATGLITDTGAGLTATNLQSANGSGTDAAGANLYLSGGQSTGTNIGGAVILATSPTNTTGSTLNALIPRIYIAPKAVTMVNNTATKLVNISLASGKWFGGHLIVTCYADNGTDLQTITAITQISAINKSGTVTTTISTSPGSPTAVSTGTMTYTASAVANGNSVDFKVSNGSSLTPTSQNASYLLFLNSNDPALSITAQ